MSNKNKLSAFILVLGIIFLTSVSGNAFTKSSQAGSTSPGKYFSSGNLFQLTDGRHGNHGTSNTVRHETYRERNRNNDRGGDRYERRDRDRGDRYERRDYDRNRDYGNRYEGEHHRRHRD